MPTISSFAILLDVILQIRDTSFHETNNPLSSQIQKILHYF